jgi:hypothetical protein
VNAGLNYTKPLGRSKTGIDRDKAYGVKLVFSLDVERKFEERYNVM